MNLYGKLEFSIINLTYGVMEILCGKCVVVIIFIINIRYIGFVQFVFVFVHVILKMILSEWTILGIHPAAWSCTVLQCASSEI